MKKISLRTKLKAVFIMIICIILVSAGALSVTRTISDTHDDVETFIRNSNGNYWEATGENIQVAIDDLGSLAPYFEMYGGTHASVWLPGNTTFIVSSTISVNDYVSLEMGGCELKPSGDFDVLLLNRGSIVRNGIINVSGVENYDSAAISFNASKCMASQIHPPVVENMILVSSSHRGKALYLHCPAGENQHFLGFITCYNIYIEHFEYGIFINFNTTEEELTYINGNIFSNVKMDDTKYCIKVYEASAEASGNYFENIFVDCSANTEYIVWDNCNGNMYINIQAFNWDNNSGERKSYTFTAGYTTYLSFRGGGNDLSLPTWSAWVHCYTIFDLEHSILRIGSIEEYYT